jgi:hypothetical protein
MLSISKTSGGPVPQEQFSPAKKLESESESETPATVPTEGTPAPKKF